MNMTRGLAISITKRLCALGAAALFFTSSGVVLADTVEFNPSVSTVNTGQTFTVDIVGSGFTELAGGIIDLGFDSTLLTVDSVLVNSTLFDFLPDGGGPAVGNTWSGIAFDTFVNAPATGNFSIATITLTAGATLGTSSLTILGSSEFFSTTELLSPILLDGTVHVVPVPAAVWLFGSGLLGLVGVARKKAV